MQIALPLMIFGRTTLNRTEPRLTTGINYVIIIVHFNKRNGIKGLHRLPGAIKGADAAEMDSREQRMSVIILYMIFFRFRRKSEPDSGPCN